MPKRDTVRQTVDLYRDDVQWFREHYPGASMQGILESLFHTFRVNSECTLKAAIEEAAKKVTEEIRR